MKKIYAVIIILLVMGVSYFNEVLYNAERSVTDRVTIEPRKVDSRIKLLAIDEKSLDTVGRWPWPRNIIAELSDQLLSKGALAVWPDIYYSNKSQNPAEDQAWEQVVAKHQNLFLPVYFDFQTRKVNRQVVVEGLQKPVIPIDLKQTGHINVIEDDDRVVRNVMLGISHEETRVPAISVKLANLLLPTDQQLVWTEDNHWLKGKTPLPVGPQNELYFSYATKPLDQSIETISISRVLSGEVDPAYFAGSVVLIGPYAMGLDDAYYTPTSKKLEMYGVAIHANVIQSLLDEKIYTRASHPVGLMVMVLLGLLAYFSMERVRAKWSILIMVGLLTIYSFAEVIVFQTLHILLPYLYPVLTIISVYIFSVVSQYLQERRERGRVTGIFGRYVSKAVVQEILSTKEEIKVGGVRKDITLVFVDIRGFTPLSEKMEPEDVIKILNEYLDLCSRAVFAQEGTIDKFIGDGVMSIFGAPIEQENHPERAIRAALQMQSEAGRLAERLLEQYGRSVSFGIGINSGPAVVGNIGSQERLDYTAIGDTVNLAARLESNAKPGQILISKETYERVKERFRVTALDPIKVKGKENLVEIFQVEGEF
ncbi:MAG TPA: adenylate/guanylate cyclase domain-containing protein [Desulfosporosinus sp.]|nr:adenylate/guanylate cyclase domain-containing protein [Desulfosporosinus sp.]